MFGIKVLDGTKYGSNNGLDHVVQYVDPQTGKTMTMVIDSKQLAINGTTSLSSTAAGTAEQGKNVLQLSDESLTVSCPSVRNTLCVEFQPLFFQRSASQCSFLMGLLHFFDCAVPASCTKTATRAGMAPASCGQCFWR